MSLDIIREYAGWKSEWMVKHYAHIIVAGITLGGQAQDGNGPGATDQSVFALSKQ
jgi:hypothetical protein